MVESKAVAALGAFARAQKEETRRRLMEAAAIVFEREGYMAPSVDDIAQQAGVSRQTFYRHFDSKLAIAMAYFGDRREMTLPYWQQIDGADARDPEAVLRWLDSMYESFRAQRNVLRTFSEIGMIEPSFLLQVREFVSDIIENLAARIPAFAGAQGTGQKARERWTEAWLLVHEIMEHLSSLAVDFAMVERELLLPALARRFVDFVERNDPAGERTT
ncbi:TetR/AcrR family transcriptional regulator [Flavisphingomonas formosensis]|uniref:TetR/AcrR family transcriptional regulator n=1 Tax=Flavisphingomonas formosensis TaxID=861534 RepID=UPI0012FC9642|nr:TetR/AcrR family transcriptional regulator [Sphingomonas formosensis]